MLFQKKFGAINCKPFAGFVPFKGYSRKPESVIHLKRVAVNIICQIRARVRGESQTQFKRSFHP
jgi:hypothetical protein